MSQITGLRYGNLYGNDINYAEMQEGDIREWDSNGWAMRMELHRGGIWKYQAQKGDVVLEETGDQDGVDRLLNQISERD
jgi:hypothetical protein